MNLNYCYTDFIPFNFLLFFSITNFVYIYDSGSRQMLGAEDEEEEEEDEKEEEEEEEEEEEGKNFHLQSSNFHLF